MNNFEIEILRFIENNFHMPLLSAVMAFVSALGNGGAVWIILACVLMCFKRTRKAGISAAVALVFSLLICNIILKPALARIRPFDFDTALLPLIPPPGDFSFPSGHTFSSFAASVALVLNNRKIGVPAVILAFLIAFSRVYLLVHYPSDVLFSIVFGTLAGICAKKLTHRLALCIYCKYQ